MPEQFEEEINTINNFNGVFQGASETEPHGEEDRALNFIWTRQVGEDPVQTLTVKIVGIDEKDVTALITS